MQKRNGPNLLAYFGRPQTLSVKEWQPARLRKKNDFSLFGKNCNQRVLKIKTFTKVVLCYILTRLVASGPIYLGRA